MPGHASNDFLHADLQPCKPKIALSSKPSMAFHPIFDTHMHVLLENSDLTQIQCMDLP